MARFLGILLWLDAALLAGTWASGYLRPPVLGTPDEFHMPLGLLTCVVTLMIQAQVLSYLITAGWDLRHVAEDKRLAPEVAARGRAIKAACLPLVAAPALGAVAAGIFGMGARAGVFAGSTHAAVTGLTAFFGAWAAWSQPARFAGLDALLAEVGLTDAARAELANR